MKHPSFTKEHEDTITCDGIEIRYRYRKSNRRTLGICVLPDLSITVTVPRGTTSKEIRDFVRARAGWIVKAWTSLEQRPKRPVYSYVSGEVHRYVGNQYRLQVIEGRQDSVRCERDCLVVTSKNAAEPERTRQILGAWYRKQAAVVFYDRLCNWQGKVLGEGTAQPKLRVREMKTRWGSCSSTGWITLNLLLIKAPAACIDYVVVHELCHLRVRGHGPGFWNLVETFMPDYKQRRKELKTYWGAC